MRAGRISGHQILAALLLANAVLGAAAVQAQTAGPELWGTDGTIATMVRVNDTLYLGGAFRNIGPNTGGAVPLDRTTGRIIPGYPRVTGCVRAIASDGHGGWYLGGSFVALGGRPCRNLGHVLADGTVDNWFPDPDGDVVAIATTPGRVIVSGPFHAIGGQQRDFLAAVDPQTGLADGFDPRPDRLVRTLLLASDFLYVGGDFTTIGGELRAGVARLDPNSGAVSPWNPDVRTFGSPSIEAIVAVGDTVYLGGAFVFIGAEVRWNLGAVLASSGASLAWSPAVLGPEDDDLFGGPRVLALAVRGGSLFVAGHFTEIDGVPRVGVVEVERATGLVTDWNPDPGPRFGAVGPDINTLVLTDSSLYVAGGFSSIGGAARSSIAELDYATAKAIDWSPPQANSSGMNTIAIGANVVYAGGAFTGMDWKRRQNLAAVNVRTGVVDDWDPAAEGLIVYALAANRGKIYVGGAFGRVGGEDRIGLAELDGKTGRATAWNPGSNETVACLQIVRDTLMVSGPFGTMGGQARQRLASFDLLTGSLTSWNPSVDGDVWQMPVRGRSVYLGGFFHTVSGQPRSHLGAVDLGTGEATSWNPEPDDFVNTLVNHERGLFVGGAFGHIGGQFRAGLALLDGNTGLALPFRANVNTIRTQALATIGDTLFVGGDYTEIGAVRRNGLAALDAETGQVLSWDADLGDWRPPSGTRPPVVWSLATWDRTLYVGGAIGRMGLLPVDNVGAFDFAHPVPPEPVPGRLDLALIWPNPLALGQSATVRFGLPGATRVSIHVYAVDGRRVSTVLDEASLPAGFHDVPMVLGSTSAGVYFCRIETAEATSTGKFVVLR